MKTLYVLRHGQAVPEDGADSDHARPLTVRGRAEARRSAEHLAKLALRPSLILSSGAVRARQTAEIVHVALTRAAELAVVEDLYLAEPLAYLEALAAQGGGHAAAVVVGHNPGLEALIYVLSDRSEHLATASLVEIELDIASWGTVAGAAHGVGRFVHVFRA